MKNKIIKIKNNPEGLDKLDKLVVKELMNNDVDDSFSPTRNKEDAKKVIPKPFELTENKSSCPYFLEVYRLSKTKEWELILWICSEFGSVYAYHCKTIDFPLTEICIAALISRDITIKINK